MTSVSIPKHLEFTSLKIYLRNNNSVIVICIYRSSSVHSDALVKLGKFLDEEVVILGALNLNWLTWASTLKNPSKSSLIDLILSNRTEKYPACGVFDLPRSVIIDRLFANRRNLTHT